MHNTNREYGIDILRLLSVLGVIVLHVFGTSSLAKNFSVSNPYCINYCGSLFLEILCMCSVNVFGIITGYLYVDKESYHSLSIIKILYSVLFYSFIITLFIKVIHPEFINGKQKFLEALFPFGIRLWYITAYIFVFFMIPFLNILIKNCSKQTFFVFICLLTILLSGFTTIGMKDYWGLLRGYSCFWLIYCYFIGAYIKTNNVKINKKCLLIYLIISVSILFALNIFSLLNGSTFLAKTYFTWRDYTSPLIVLNGICIFLLFKDSNLSNMHIRKILAVCSNSALAVYIIHAQGLVLDNFIYPFLPNRIKHNSLRFFIVGFMVVIIIFVYCLTVDIIRQWIEKKCKIDVLEYKLSKHLDKLLNY